MLRILRLIFVSTLVVLLPALTLIGGGAGKTIQLDSEPCASPMATPPAPADPAATPPSLEQEATPFALGATPAVLICGAEPITASGDDVTIQMEDIFYVPAQITIPANTDVTIRLPNTGVLPHNFSIDELDVYSPVIDGGEETSVVVNAEPGEYVFYCIVAGHRESGMVGTLIVE